MELVSRKDRRQALVTLTPTRSEETISQTAGHAATHGDFPVSAPAANPVFYRTYSRRLPKGRESWNEVSERNRSGLQKLGSLNPEEIKLIARMQAEKKLFRLDVGNGLGEHHGSNNPKIFLEPTTAPQQILLIGKRLD